MLSKTKLSVAWGLAVAAGMLLCDSLAIAQGPENTLVVVNADSPDSLAVANHYVQLRSIPSTNVVYLNGISTPENTVPESSNSGFFQKSILTPILNRMEQRRIVDQIDCIAYSTGFPTRIKIGALSSKYLKKRGMKYQIQLHAPWASLSSLTYFHKNAFSNDPDFLELEANRYALLRPLKITDNPFEGESADEFDEAIKSIDDREYAVAEEKLLTLFRNHPEQIAVVYALAKTYAQSGQTERTIQALEYARSRGFSRRSIVAKENAFESMRNNQQFIALLESMEDLPNQLTSTKHFSQKSYWSKNGWANNKSGQGEKYILSTVLALTGERRSTLSQALDQLSSSVSADGTKPDGLVYYAKHKDARSKTRHAQFASGTAELNSLNRNVKVGSEKLPPKGSTVIGATLGSPKLKWKSSGSRFAPGAICDNFTSFGGWWEKKAQTQLSEFLNAGAAGACGTVYEPYTIYPKIPSARLHAHYARGATLAEAFYQSVSGPFQLLIVGDPLCCPFGDFPKFDIVGLPDGSVVKDDLRLKIKPSPESPKARSYELFFDGVFLSKVRNPDKVEIATDGLNDGYHELRVVGIANSPTANRTSERLRFQLDRRGESIELIVPNTKVKLGTRLKFQARSSKGSEIQVYQNSRVVAAVSNDREGSIDSAMLGLGKSELLAAIRTENGSLQRSRPVEVWVVR